MSEPLRIWVAVKHGIDVGLTRPEPSSGTVPLATAPRKTSDFDKNAVEEAVRIRERLGGKVTALSVGLPAAREALREALAIGADEAILRIISWGPYREGIQKSVEERVLKAYEKLGKPLHELSTEEARGLGRLYRLSRHEGGSRWQMSFLLSLVRFLRQHKLTMLDLKNSLKDDPPEVAELVLQTALGTSSTKIVHCYMRDCLKLEAFPIDRGVKKVLKRAGIPERPWPIIYSCRRQGIKVRVLARACNIYSDGLLQ